MSPLVGIVTQTLSTTYDDGRGVPSELRKRARVRPPTLGLATVDFGSGAHPEPARARAAAIGEALERYSALFVPEERVRTTTAAALGDAAVRPARFALFHPTQLADPRFPFVEFGEETPATVRPGHLARTTEAPAFLPAEIVYLGRPATAHCRSRTRRAAGSPARRRSPRRSLRALLEVVERDAVMLAWKCRLSLPLLDWDGGRRHPVVRPAVLRDRRAPVQRARRERLPRRCRSRSRSCTDSPTSGASLAVGAGAAATVAEAWLTAVSEGFGVYRWLRQQTLALPGAAASRPRPRRDVRRAHALLCAPGAGRARVRSSTRPTSDARPRPIRPLEGTTPQRADRRSVRAARAPRRRRVRGGRHVTRRRCRSA